MTQVGLIYRCAFAVARALCSPYPSTLKCKLKWRGTCPSWLYCSGASDWGSNSPKLPGNSHPAGR